MAINFLEDIPLSAPGVLGHGPHTFVGSRKISANAPAGVYVLPLADGTCELPDSAAKVARRNGGVLELLVDRIANANGLEYASGDLVRYVKSGHIVVKTEQAVSDQDQCFIRYGAGTGTQLGAFRKDADTLTGVVTVITTADNAVLEVEINGTKFEYTSSTSQTAAQKATAFAAIIDATAAFAAAAVGAAITVTPASGTVEFGSSSPAEILTTALGGSAAKLEGARFQGDWASGYALVSLPSAS